MAFLDLITSDGSGGSKYKEVVSIGGHNKYYVDVAYNDGNGVHVPTNGGSGYETGYLRVSTQKIIALKKCKISIIIANRTNQAAEQYEYANIAEKDVEAEDEVYNFSVASGLNYFCAHVLIG